MVINQRWIRIVRKQTAVLRAKLNAILVPTIGVTLALVVGIDYRHEANAVIHTHDTHDVRAAAERIAAADACILAALRALNRPFEP